MWRLWNSPWHGRASVVAMVVLSIFSMNTPVPMAQALGSPLQNSSPKENAQALTVRWGEQQPGCTFSRGDDGKYRYGLWSGDVGIILAMDAREVQLVSHRIEPIFGVWLTIRYRGTDSLDASPDGITLRFMKHFKVEQSSLDPDDYSQKIQADADAFDDETRRAIAKHPNEKQARETRLQEYQKSVNELIEFLSRNGFCSAALYRAQSQTNGCGF